MRYRVALILKLAFRNIMGAGLRTWLNVLVLSLAFVAIIWMQGFINGAAREAMTAMIHSELGGGQIWHHMYDRYDPLTVEESHAPLSPSLTQLVSNRLATPILIAPAAIFPGGRVQNILLKGIDPAQQILNIPTKQLQRENRDGIPALIGSRMAEQSGLNVGDLVTVRWRDVHGTFDAADLEIVEVMHTTVASIDLGQIWVPLETLREMIQAPHEATLLVLARDITDIPPDDSIWRYRSLDFLLQDLKAMIRAKSVSNGIMYGLLLFMALLAIFDTQVLAIFRRRKEMGTLMALGMPRSQVIQLFTLEGALHGMLALIVGAVYGIPLLLYFAKHGFAMPEMSQDSGFAIPSTLYPNYGLKLVLGTTLLVLITVTIVSYWPARKIAEVQPTEALRGGTA